MKFKHWEYWHGFAWKRSSFEYMKYWNFNFEIVLDEVMPRVAVHTINQENGLIMWRMRVN